MKLKLTRCQGLESRGQCQGLENLSLRRLEANDLCSRTPRLLITDVFVVRVGSAFMFSSTTWIRNSPSSLVNNFRSQTVEPHTRWCHSNYKKLCVLISRGQNGRYLSLAFFCHSIEYSLNRFLDLETHKIDTKFIKLLWIQAEISVFSRSCGHLGRHLGFWPISGFGFVWHSWK